jgi:hypothetical protein
MNGTIGGRAVAAHSATVEDVWWQGVLIRTDSAFDKRRGRGAMGGVCGGPCHHDGLLTIPGAATSAAQSPAKPDR